MLSFSRPSLRSMELMEVSGPWSGGADGGLRSMDPVELMEVSGPWSGGADRGLMLADPRL